MPSQHQQVFLLIFLFILSCPDMSRCPVLEIQFQPVKCRDVTKIMQNFQATFIQIKAIMGCKFSKLLQKVFNPLATKRAEGGAESVGPQSLCFCYFFVFAKFLQAVVPGYQLAQIVAGKQPFPNRVIRYFFPIEFPLLSKQLQKWTASIFNNITSKLMVGSLIEYNLEFQGSVQNLQKRALFMKFYPEMP